MTEKMLEYVNGYKFSFKRYGKQDIKTGPKETPRFVSIQFDKSKSSKRKISPAIQQQLKNNQFLQLHQKNNQQKDNSKINSQLGLKKHYSSQLQELQQASAKKTNKNLHRLQRARSVEQIIQQSNSIERKSKKQDTLLIRSKTSEKKVRLPMSNRILQKMFPTMKKESQMKIKTIKSTYDQKQYYSSSQKISQMKQESNQLKKNLFKKQQNDKIVKLMQQWSKKEIATRSKIQSIVYPVNLSKTKIKVSKSTKNMRINTDDTDKRIKDNKSVNSNSSIRQETKNIYNNKEVRKKTDRISKADIINPLLLPSAKNDLIDTSSFNEFKNITSKAHLIPQLILQSQLIEDDNKTKLSLRSGAKLLKKPHKNLKLSKIQEDYNKKINEILNKLHGMSVKSEVQMQQTTL